MMGFGMSGIGMGLFWLLIIIAVIAAAGLFSGRSTRTGTDTDSRSALEILKTRYAAGEITRGEFEDKKRRLTRATS